MSRVRKDRCSFKAGSIYFFYKKDEWGSFWHHNRFSLFFITEGLVCYKDRYSDRIIAFDKPVQDAYQNWLVDTILLGDK